MSLLFQLGDIFNSTAFLRCVLISLSVTIAEFYTDNLTAIAGGCAST